MEEYRNLFIIPLILFLFLACHLVTNNYRIILFLERKWSGDHRIFAVFFFRKLTGFLLLGIFPALIFMSLKPEILSQIDWEFRLSPLTWGITVVLILLIISLNLLAGRQPDVYRKYPQMRFRKWNILRFTANLAGWSLYLIAYEFLFRGIFFTWCFVSYGLWPAIILNSLVYSGVHLNQGKKETIGALFFGVILCLLVWHSGSILPAILLHASLTFSMDISAIWHNPEMDFSGSLLIRKR